MTMTPGRRQLVEQLEQCRKDKRDIVSMNLKLVDDIKAAEQERDQMRTKLHYTLNKNSGCACRFDEAEETVLQWCGLHGEVRDALKAAESERDKFRDENIQLIMDCPEDRLLAIEVRKAGSSTAVVKSIEATGRIIQTALAEHYKKQVGAAEQELTRYKAVYTAAEALNFTEFAKDGRYTIDANPEALDALGVALAAKESDDGK